MLAQTALPVQGEESTLPFSGGGPHLAARDHPAGIQHRRQPRRWSHRSHTEAGLAPFMPAGSLGGLGECIRGAGHGTQVTNLEMQPDTSHSTVPARPPNAQKRPCHGARSAGPISLTESVSFGSHPAHSPLQPLCCLRFYLGQLGSRQPDLDPRDLDLGSQGSPAPASNHGRLILRLGGSLARSRAACAHRLLGWGARSTHLPLLAEMQRDLRNLPDRATRSRVRAQEK